MNPFNRNVVTIIQMGKTDAKGFSWINGFVYLDFLNKRKAVSIQVLHIFPYGRKLIGRHKFYTYSIINDISYLHHLDYHLSQGENTSIQTGATRFSAIHLSKARTNCIRRQADKADIGNRGRSQLGKSLAHPILTQFSFAELRHVGK